MAAIDQKDMKNVTKDEESKICDNWFDTFTKDFLDAFFDTTIEETELPNIEVDHILKVYAFPSVFSNDNSIFKNSDNLIHRKTRLLHKIEYKNWWEQFIDNSFGIDEMFVLTNLKGYDNDVYDIKDKVEAENCLEGKESNEKCENYKKYKKYEMMTSAKGNPLITKEYKDIFRPSRIFKNT